MKRPSLGMALLIASAFSLCMAGLLVPQFNAANPHGSDIVVRVLGGVTELAAESAYRRADVYLHAGVTGEDLHGPDCWTSAKDLPFVGLVRRLHGETAPKEHRHLQGREQEELLPWFVAAVRLNPGHVDAWREGAFWFYHIGELRRAEDFISDAIRHNPNDYRLYMDRGVLYFRMERWDESVRDLRAALRCWRDCSEDSRYELRAIRRYLEHALPHVN